MSTVQTSKKVYFNMPKNTCDLCPADDLCSGKSETWDLAPVSKSRSEIRDIDLPGTDGAAVRVRAASFYMPMQDGTGLFTMIAAPLQGTADDKYPIVFIRSCYESSSNTLLEDFCSSNSSWLSRGYAVVFQHCRGTGASEGDFIPYAAERADGLHTLSKIRLLPFYNAEIFLTGASYLSSVHYSYLSDAPDDIKGAVLLVQGITRYNFTYRNSILKMSSTSWRFTQYRKNTIPERNFSLDSFKELPLSDMTKRVFGERVTFIDNILKNSDPAAEYWNTQEGGSEYRKALTNYRFPVLFVGGMHDVYTGDNFEMWRSLAPEQRKISSMIMTPYDHCRSTTFCEKFHTINFEHGNLDDEWPEFRYHFFEYCRDRSKKPDFIKPGRLTYYGLWEKKWHTEPDLQDGTRKIDLFLGDHSLRKTPSEGSVTFVYDPTDPVSFEGGCDFRMGSSMAVQDKPDFRHDVVSFISDPAEENLKIRGRITAGINVSTDCEDTAFYLRLSIVKNGVAYCLREDISAVSGQHPDYIPGSTVPLKFCFTDHAFTLEKGDCLRLDISSSCWPTFLPHTNLKGERFYHTSTRIARNRIEFADSTVTLCCQ